MKVYKCKICGEVDPEETMDGLHIKQTVRFNPTTQGPDFINQLCGELSFSAFETFKRLILENQDD